MGSVAPMHVVGSSSTTNPMPNRATVSSDGVLHLQGRTDWIVGDISVLHAHFDTILQNPPFGVQKERADRKFLATSIELGSRVYSLHKSGESNRAFIKNLIERHGARVTGIYSMKLNIPRLFKFHTKPKHEVNVDLYRIETGGN